MGQLFAPAWSTQPIPDEAGPDQKAHQPMQRQHREIVDRPGTVLRVFKRFGKFRGLVWFPRVQPRKHKQRQPKARHKDRNRVDNLPDDAHGRITRKKTPSENTGRPSPKKTEDDPRCVLINRPILPMSTSASLRDKRMATHRLRNHQIAG